MDDKRFWDVIAFACKHDVDDFFDWYSPLVKTLAKFAPDEILRFDRWFDERADALYTRLHWGAAYLINGGASDDGFYYWRCWLVGMGKGVYEAALADPDSLADVVEREREYEAEIYSVARAAWMKATKAAEDEDHDPFAEACEALGKRGHGDLTGDEWDYDDDEVRRRLPRLAALYLDDADDEGHED